MRSTEDEYAVSLANLFRILWKRLWVIALVAILFTAAAVGFSLAQTPQYQASVTLLVSQKQGEEGISNLGSEVAGVQSLVQTAAAAISSRPIAEAVTEGLQLETTPDALLENVSVQTVPDTQFIEISYTDTDPERAQKIVSSIGAVSSNQVSQVSADAITAEVWESAVAPTDPVSPAPFRNGILAMGLGLMLGTGLAILLEFMDDSWRSPEEVERVLGTPTFGVIPEVGASKDKAPKRGSR